MLDRGHNLTLDSKMDIESIKEYFKFTRKERIGIVCLSLLVLCIAWLPRFIKDKPITDPVILGEYKKAVEQLKTEEPDSTDSKEDEPVSPARSSYRTYTPETPSSFFKFDPNTLDEAGWRKLGIKEKTIGTIKKYLSKGGSFKTASDIHKIYGISPSLAGQLEPWVVIAKDSEAARTTYKKFEEYPRKEYSPKTRIFVDINQSDTADWIALPGIGPALARRVILFREKLGGFHSIEQISETYGLIDSVYQLIKPSLQLKLSVVTKLNINSADANRLKQHPYIGWKLANALVKFRESHGPFKNPSDLSQIDLFTPQLLLKLIPYLSVE